MFRIPVFFWIVCLFGLGACTTDLEIKHVPLDPLFHDNSSKVWVMDSIFDINKTNYSPKELVDKELIIFYSDGNCIVEKTKHLGQHNQRLVPFRVDSKFKELSIYMKERLWRFEIFEVTPFELLLTPTKDSDFQYSVILKPFPVY
jgi:hypothetical protein